MSDRALIAPAIRHWPRVRVARSGDVPKGRLMVIQQPWGSSLGIATTIIQQQLDDIEGIVYLDNLPEEGRCNVEGLEYVDCLHFDDDWSIRLSRDIRDFKFASRPDDAPMGALLLDQDGPVAIALRSPHSRPAFYIFKSRTVISHRPRAMAVAMKWSVVLDGSPDGVPPVMHLHLGGKNSDILVFLVQYPDRVVLLELNDHKHFRTDPVGSLLHSLHVSCLQQQDQAVAAAQVAADQALKLAKDQKQQALKASIAKMLGRSPR